MAVCFFILSLTAVSQEPAAKKKEKPTHASMIVQDTTIVTREADSLYVKQSIVMNRLDSLIQEKQKK